MSFFPPVCIRLGAVVLCFVGTVVYGLFCREQFARVGGCAEIVKYAPLAAQYGLMCVFVIP